MRRRLWIMGSLAGLLAGCASGGGGEAPVASPATGETGGWIVRQGGDTIAMESFTRGAEALLGELAGRTSGRRITYEAASSPDARIPRIVFGVGPASGPPAQTGSAVFSADSVRIDIEGGPSRVLATEEGTLPFINLSGAVLEQIVRRATVLGGDRVEVPLLNLFGGGTFSVTVERLGPDSVSLVFPPGLEVRAAVDPGGRLLGARVPAQGVIFERGGVQMTSSVAPSTAPDYAAPEGAPYEAREVRMATPGGQDLVGTLTLPAGSAPAPAVILVSGSGPQDRDAAVFQGYRPFREVADTLSRRGIAVLRFDERDVGASGGTFRGATTEDFAEDVIAAVRYLRSRPEIAPERIALVGHSEGGLVAPMVAAKDPAVAAVVLMAAPARPGGALLRYQARYLHSMSGLTGAALDSALVAHGELVRSEAESDPWLRFFAGYDPRPALREIAAPVLILQGETDRQVPPEQAEEIAAELRGVGNRDVVVRVFPDVNHLLVRDASGDFRGYRALPSKAVAPEVLGTLAEWLARELR